MPTSAPAPALARRSRDQGVHVSVKDDPDTETVTRELLVMVGLLKVASDIITRVIDDHPQGCGCGFCGQEHYRLLVEEDLPGLRWHMGCGPSLIYGCLRGNVDLDNTTVGEALRKLADAYDVSEREAIPAPDCTCHAEPVH